MMAREEVQELTDSSCTGPSELKGVLVREARPAKMICTNSNSNYLSPHGGRDLSSESCTPLQVSKRRPRLPTTVEINQDDRTLFSNKERDYYDGESDGRHNNRRKGINI